MSKKKVGKKTAIYIRKTTGQVKNKKVPVPCPADQPVSTSTPFEQVQQAVENQIEKISDEDRYHLDYDVFRQSLNEQIRGLRSQIKQLKAIRQQRRPSLLQRLINFVRRR